MTTRIQVFSDLHLEFGGDLPEIREDIDVLIIPGDYDIYSYGKLKHLSEKYEHIKNIIFVPGNCEYYGNNITDTINTMKEEVYYLTNIHLLNRDYVFINGILFIGATLWTDFNLYGIVNKFAAQEQAKKQLDDFKKIKTSGDILLTPEICSNYHYEDKAFIIDKLSSHKYEIVVITHHGPSEHSGHEKYEGNILNPSFMSNLDGIIERYQPTAWIHGHVHHGVSKQLGSTKLLANPRGYSFDPNPDFDENLIIEI